MGSSATAFFTGRIAKALENRRDSHVLADGGDGIIHLVILDLANHTRHFRVDGTKSLAGSFTVTNVFTEKQIQGGLATLTYFLTLGVDFHAVSHRRAAGGMNPTGGFVFYLTNHTGGEIVIPLLVAHHGDINSDLLGRLINRDWLIEFQFLIVDC